MAKQVVWTMMRAGAQIVQAFYAEGIPDAAVDSARWPPHCQRPVPVGAGVGGVFL